MKSLLNRIEFAIRRFCCRIAGHVRIPISMDNVGLTLCRRCLVITDMKTLRRDITDGDIERYMSTHCREGFDPGFALPNPLCEKFWP